MSVLPVRLSQRLIVHDRMDKATLSSECHHHLRLLHCPYYCIVDVHDEHHHLLLHFLLLKRQKKKLICECICIFLSLSFFQFMTTEIYRRKVNCSNSLNHFYCRAPF